MLESEIKEQIITQAKNISFMNSIIKEIDALPEKEADKRADEYFFYIDKLHNTDCLEDSITRRRLLHEMNSNTHFTNSPNLYRELIDTAIQELKSNNYIYWIDNRYSCKENISNKSILEYFVKNFYRKQIRFGGYITRSDFKKWTCEVLTKMNYAFSKESIKKQIDFLL